MFGNVNTNMDSKVWDLVDEYMDGKSMDYTDLFDYLMRILDEGNFASLLPQNLKDDVLRGLVLDGIMWGGLCLGYHDNEQNWNATQPGAPCFLYLTIMLAGMQQEQGLPPGPDDDYWLFLDNVKEDRVKMKVKEKDFDSHYMSLMGALLMEIYKRAGVADYGPPFDFKTALEPDKPQTIKFKYNCAPYCYQLPLLMRRPNFVDPD
jgi:hypothetical protein